MPKRIPVHITLSWTGPLLIKKPQYVQAVAMTRRLSWAHSADCQLCEFIQSYIQEAVLSVFNYV